MKLMKKIAPFAASLLMLGATAAAADLATWKSSFPGADTAIVVGAASTVDTIGAVDLTAALTVTTTSTTSQPVANAHLIKAAGAELNYNEDFQDVEEILDDRDLPTLLMDGRYKESRGETTNDQEYDQTLTFLTGTNTFVFDTKEDGDEAAGSYVKLDDGEYTYVYDLEFGNAIEFDGTGDNTDDDFKLSKLSFMGREYTITEASDDGAGILDELVLMAGAVKATQEEYSTATYTVGSKTYTVEVPIISDTGNSVVLKVNGETTDEMEEADTYVLDDDTVIGIVDVVPNEGTERSTGSSEGNDIVTFYLGAEKIVLANENQIRINNEDISGSIVVFDDTDGDFVSDAVADELGKITVAYEPDDNIYVGIGESWTDPILGRMKYTFQGFESDTEEIKATTTSDDGKLVLKNNGGDSLTIPLVDDDVDVGFGDKLASELSATITNSEGVGNLIIGNGADCTDLADVEECEGMKFLTVSTGGEARIIKVVNVDTANDEIDLYDETTGTSLNDKDYTDGVSTTINLGFTTVDLTVDEGGFQIVFDDINAFTADAGYTNAFVTDLGAEVGIEYGLAGVDVYVADVDGNDLVGDIAFTYGLDGDDDMVITEDPNSALTWMTEKENSDYQMAIDAIDYGAVFKFDSEDDNDLTVTYPEEEVVANVYVSEELTNIPELGTSTGSGIAPIAVMDDQIDNVKTKNIIAIGGSAINKVAAELLGISYPTYGSDSAWTAATGVDGAGKAVVKLMNSPYTTGKYAMLVAGWEGTDTTRAAKALREGTPALAGMSTTLNTATSTVTVLSS